MTWSEHGYLAWLAEQLVPDMADDHYLARWSRIFNVRQKPATAASGANLLWSAAAHPVGGLPLLAENETTLFTTTTGAPISAGGSVTVPISAAQPGTATDLGADSVLTLGQAIAGVSLVATVAAPGATGGADQETAEAWRSRILLRIRTQPQGGAKVDHPA